MTLSSFPEELLERILSLSSSQFQFQSNPSHRPRTLSTPLSNDFSPFNPPPTHDHPLTTLLLVSKSWLRIATPLIYRKIQLHSPRTATLFTRTLTDNPALGTNVRHLVLSGTYPEFAPVVRACPAIDTLEVTLDNSATTETEAVSQTADVCQALACLTGVTKLIVHKANVYLSQPKPRQVIAGLARAIDNWEHLSTAHIAFRLADDATGTGALLAHSLSCAPALHTLVTSLPAVWNPALLRISANPRLERIVLNTGDSSPTRHGRVGSAVVGTGLFLMEARKWDRLSELIRAGTSIIRTRAHTMGTVCVSSTVGCNGGCMPQLPQISSFENEEGAFVVENGWGR